MAKCLQQKFLIAKSKVTLQVQFCYISTLYVQICEPKCGCKIQNGIFLAMAVNVTPYFFVPVENG